MKINSPGLCLIVLTLTGCNADEAAVTGTQAVHAEDFRAVTEAEIAALFDRWNGSEWLITSHHSSAMPEREQE